MKTRMLAVVLGFGLLAACGDTINNTTIVGVTTTAAGAATAAAPTTAAAAATTAGSTAAASGTTATAAATAATTKATTATTAPATTAVATTVHLGNSLTQAPPDVIVDGCAKADADSCNELDSRVAAYGEPDHDSTVGPASQEYLCLFYAQWAAATNPTFGLTYLQKLLAVTGPAPGGVTDGIARLLKNPNDTTGRSSLTGYVGPICGD